MNEYIETFFEETSALINKWNKIPDTPKLEWRLHELSRLSDGSHSEVAEKAKLLCQSLLELSYQDLSQDVAEVQESASQTILLLSKADDLAKHEEIWSQIFQNPQSPLRPKAAQALVRMSSDKGWDLLIPALGKSEEHAIRHELKLEFQNNRTSKAFSRFLFLLKAEPRFLRRWAWGILRTHQHWTSSCACELCKDEQTWLTLFKEHEPGEIHNLAAQKLTELKSQEGMELMFIAFEQASSKHAKQLRKIMTALQLGARWTSRWSEYLSHQQAAIRWNAAKALEKMPFDSLVRHKLLATLSDPKLEVRLAALQTLSRWKEQSPYFVNLLWQELHTHNDQIGVAVLKAVSILQRSEFAPFVLNLVWHPDSRRRIAAMRCLGVLGYQGALDPLLSLADNPNEPLNIRMEALSQAKRLAGPSNSALVQELAQKRPEFESLRQSIENHIYEWKQRFYKLENMTESSISALNWYPEPTQTFFQSLKAMFETKKKFWGRPQRNVEPFQFRKLPAQQNDKKKLKNPGKDLSN